MGSKPNKHFGLETASAGGAMPNVASLLRPVGVNQSLLSVAWFGETQPAVATGDGVKEPLNRRSTISISFEGARGTAATVSSTPVPNN